MYREILEISDLSRLNFKGQVFVENHHLAVPFHELLPMRDKGLSETASLHDNLIIHGDNLAALKSLLPTYHGKVKCIYIDPPYNTGNEGWAYNDKVNSPLMQDWLGQVVDRDDLTRHDKWCCMMLPRLKLLRELLREDGVIFVPIDDNEVHHLRCLMDEVFGEENFVATIIWHKMDSPKNTARHLSEDHDYVTLYARDAARWQPNHLPRSEEMLKRYQNPDNDPRGAWLLSDLAARNRYSKGRYAIETPSGKKIEEPPAGSYWQMSKMKFRELDNDNRIWWGELGANQPEIKQFHPRFARVLFHRQSGTGGKRAVLDMRSRRCARRSSWELRRFFRHAQPNQSGLMSNSGKTMSDQEKQAHCHSSMLICRNGQGEKESSRRYDRSGITFIELLRMFPSDSAAEKWLVKRRWPSRIACVSCNSINVQKATKHRTVPSKCREKERGEKFSVRTGTAMDSSKMGPQTWMSAIYIVMSSLKGVPRMKLHRDLDILQKAAWSLLYRLREAMSTEDVLFSGSVQAEETYMGHLEANKHSDKKMKAAGGPVGKAIVAGVKDQATNTVVARVVPDTKAPTLTGMVGVHASAGSEVFTEEARGYLPLSKIDYRHRSVSHSTGQWADQQAHTNEMESFWAVLKRGYHGTYHQISPDHLDRYVADFSHHRNEWPRDTIDQIDRKRLTYAELTADGVHARRRMEMST